MGYGRFLPPTPLTTSLALLLLAVLVSLYATFEMLFSLGKIAGITYGIALYFTVVAATAVSWRRFAAGIILYFTAGTGLTGLALLGMSLSPKFPLLRDIVALLPPRLVEVPGTVGGVNTNQTAGILLWLVPLAIVIVWGLWRYFAQLRRQIWFIPAILFLLAATAVTLFLTTVLLITQSRSALLGFGISLFLIFAIALRRWKWLLLGALALTVLASGLLVTKVGSEQITGLLFGQVGVADVNVLNALDSRLEIWSRAIYGIQDFPITGMGMNNFRRVVHILYPLFLLPPDTDIAHAHNHLLQTALDLGLPGLIAYLAIWFGAATMLWQTWQNATHDMSKIFVVGFAASLLAYFVYGMIDAVALGAKPGFLFWVLLGLITGHYQLVNREAIE
jgi:putative inorganic carbon (HCO3(-)) transporter